MGRKRLDEFEEWREAADCCVAVACTIPVFVYDIDI